MNIAVIIPFRDRGRDPRRPANLQRVLNHWLDFSVTQDATVAVVSDGRCGYQSFNRSAAYNRGAARTDADVLVYSESDLLVDDDQILQACDQAASAPGLVVPFSRFMAITAYDSQRVRDHELAPEDAQANQICGERQSIGAVNVVSRESLELIGQYDEAFEGAWYDDNAMCRAFEVCCGPTRFIDGPGYHLYHLPGASGDHLTDADRAATERNKARYQLYKQAQTPERIRELTTGAQ
ncbi:hypothetical protein B5566_02520 [Mycobacterium sp. MHSD3]|nr:hypothetical protein B5566_02520 [Mycobacterium sp. MHSD3]